MIGVPAEHQQMHKGAFHLTLQTPETDEKINFSHRNATQT
jgi:hypothetical protein